MQQDFPGSYGSISRFNHWLGAAIVVTMLAIGLYFEGLPRGDAKTYWMKLHISIGATAFLFLAFRIIWRARKGFIQPFVQPRVLQKLSNFVHVLLLLGIAVLILSGPFVVWTGGREVEFFELFGIPSLTGERKQLHEVLEVVHVTAANVVLFSVIVHVIGALKHLLFERSRFLGRMVGRAKP